MPDYLNPAQQPLGSYLAQAFQPPQTATAPTSLSLTPELIMRIQAEMAARQPQPPATTGPTYDQAVAMLHALRVQTGQNQ